MRLLGFLLDWFDRGVTRLVNWEAWRQAKVRQRHAKFPYCERGGADCFDTRCSCINSLEYRARFIDAAMRDLDSSH